MTISPTPLNYETRYTNHFLSYICIKSILHHHPRSFCIIVLYTQGGNLLVEGDARGGIALRTIRR